MLKPAKTNAFCEHLLDLLEPIGRVQVKAMFGGFGVLHDGMNFGCVFNDKLYLKVDDENRARFIAQSLGPFIYQSKSGPMEMRYHEAPPEALDDSALLCEWAETSIAVARRARARKKPTKKKPTPATRPAANPKRRKTSR